MGGGDFRSAMVLSNLWTNTGAFKAALTPILAIAYVLWQLTKPAL